MRRSVLALRLAVAVALWPGLAEARKGELTDDTPYTVEPGEVRLGLTDLSIGLGGHELLRRVEIGASPLVWSVGLLGVDATEVHGKFEFWRDDHLSLAVRAGYAHLDFEPLTGMRSDFYFVPVEGWAGLRLPRGIRLNAGLVYTHVSVGAGDEVGPIDDLGGAVGSSNLEYRVNAQLPLNGWLSFVAGGQLLGWQEQWLAVRAEEGVGNGEASNTTEYRGDLLSVGDAWAVSGALHLHARRFNLRLGATYGNYHVPIVNLVAPQKGWLPVVDLYWRFN